MNFEEVMYSEVYGTFFEAKGWAKLSSLENFPGRVPDNRDFRRNLAAWERRGKPVKSPCSHIEYYGASSKAARNESGIIRFKFKLISGKY